MTSMSYKFLPYKQSLSLLIDFYELTMAYCYFKSGLDNKEAVFHLYYRNNPFKGGFAVTCGLSYVIDYLRNFKFGNDDIKYLSSLKDDTGNLIFEKDFLTHIKDLKFGCNIDALPEGTVVFPYEPILRVSGPLLQCQILETILLNIINFQTLIATKAARIYIATNGEPVIEFGLRRAQGFDGGLTASRAAYIGGVSATSNVLAGKTFNIPVKGTHSHSLVMAFDNELESFKTYSEALPNNCIFLVDTYDTLRGTKNATLVAKELEKRGYKFGGIRLDSGDLAELSIKAKEILNKNGLQSAKIVASNELDELIIKELKEKGAKINAWGVGTKLASGYSDSALDGVYKLSAIKGKNGGNKWEYKIKLSEHLSKVSNPGILQVRRFTNEKELIGDVIYDVNLNSPDEFSSISILDSSSKKVFKNHNYKDLLIPIFKNGKLIYDEPNIKTIRENTISNLNKLPKEIKLLTNPDRYFVGLEETLNNLKKELILKAKGLAKVK